MITERIRAGVLELPDDIAVRGPVYVSAHTSSMHPPTAIFRADSGAARAGYAVKLVDVNSAPHAADWLRREHDTLTRLAGTKAAGGPLAPVPLGLVAQDGIAVAEWVEGVSLRRYLQLNRLRTNRRLAAVRRAGSWLAAFHDAFGRRDSRFSAQGEMARIEALLAGFDFDYSPRYRKLLASYRAAVERLDGAIVTTSRCHGDFSPNNLILEASSGGLRGIDFSHPERAPIVRDMAQFLLNGAVTGRIRAGAAGDDGCVWRASREWQALAAGYGSGSARGLEPWLSVYGLAWLVLRLGNQERTLGDRSLGVMRRIERIGRRHRLFRQADILVADLRGRK